MSKPKVSVARDMNADGDLSLRWSVDGQWFAPAWLNFADHNEAVSFEAKFLWPALRGVADPRDEAPVLKHISDAAGGWPP